MVVILKQESNFKPTARNGDGIGLGQIEPLWADYFDYKHHRLWDWRFNLETTYKILKYYKKNRKADGIRWASAYHSMTPKYRNRYYSKIKGYWNRIKNIDDNLILH